MRKLLALIVLLTSAAAFAQTTPPQGNPPQAAPDKTAPATAEAKPVKPPKPTEETAPKGKSVAERAQNCLKIDDNAIARLACYDAGMPPKIMPKPPAVKGILDCRHLKEQDERLECFDGFAQQIPKFTH